MDNRMAIEAGVVKAHIKDVQGDLPTKARAVMAEAWKGGSGLFCLSEDEKFQVAVAILITLVEGAEKERVLYEVKMLQSLNAAISGVPVDLGSLSEEAERMGFEPVGLIKIWNDVKGS